MSSLISKPKIGPKALTSLSASKNAPLTLGKVHSKSDIYLWQKHQDSFSRQVKVEELLLRDALEVLKSLKQKLQKYKDHVSGVQKWDGLIDAILLRRRTCRVTAVVEAPTGAGKSTLSNAIIGIRISPTDDARACTSVIVEVLWNPAIDPASRFKATIEFLQESEWQLELEQLYRDIEVLGADRSEDGDDVDEDELDYRIQVTMEKVRTVYPQIDKLSDLKETNLPKLMRHENVNNLGETLEFKDKDPKKLISKIKQYLVSSTSTRKFAPWPLVKLARIYVKSEVLKDGLVLVDNPGSMDINLARSALAESYRKDASVHLILASSKRAPSDQGPLLNLSKTYRLNRELDGQWRANNIIFIVVRTDESMIVDEHIENHPEVLASLSEVLKKEKSFVEAKSAVQKEIDTITAEYETKREATKELSAKIKPLGTWLKAMPQIENVPVKIRQRGGLKLAKAVLALDGLSEEAKSRAQYFKTLHEDRERINKEKQDISKAKARKAARLKLFDIPLKNAKCAKTRACIAHRSQIQTAEIRESFARMSKEVGKGLIAETLPVYCVSAIKFLDLEDGKPAEPGFPRKADTQIPQLRERLVATTLKPRHENARLALEEIAGLIQPLRAWVKNIDSAYQISPSERKQLEDTFGKNVKSLLEAFSKLHSEATRDAQEAMANFFNDIIEIEEKAASNAMTTVAEFSKQRPGQPPLHPSTYFAILRRSGDCNASKKREGISWNDDLAHNYLGQESFKARWQAFFDQKFNDIHYKTFEAAKVLLIDFAKAMTDLAKKTSPQLAEPLQQLQDSIVLLEHILHEQYTMTFKTKISAIRRDTHRRIRPQIKQFMTTFYERANAESGKGKLQRIRAHLKIFIKDNGLAMYQQSTSTLSNSLDRMIKNLSKGLSEAPNNLVTKIQSLFELMLNNHSQNAISNDKQALITRSHTLRKEVNTELDKIISAWGQEDVDIPADEEEEPLPSYELDLKMVEREGSDDDEDDEGSD